jgi:hypothetical protein
MIPFLVFVFVFLQKIVFVKITNIAYNKNTAAPAYVQ